MEDYNTLNLEIPNVLFLSGIDIKEYISIEDKANEKFMHQEELDNLNLAQTNFNIVNERLITVINANFLWQSVLYYCFNTIQTTITNNGVKGMSPYTPFTYANVLRHAINILRQIQFSDIDGTTTSSVLNQDTSGLKWQIGFKIIAVPGAAKPDANKTHIDEIFNIFNWHVK